MKKKIIVFKELRKKFPEDTPITWIPSGADNYMGNEEVNIPGYKILNSIARKINADGKFKNFKFACWAAGIDFFRHAFQKVFLLSEIIGFPVYVFLKTLIGHKTNNGVLLKPRYDFLFVHIPGTVTHNYSELSSRVKEFLFKISEEEHKGFLDIYFKGKYESYLDGRAISRLKKYFSKRKQPDKAQPYRHNKY